MAKNNKRGLKRWIIMGLIIVVLAAGAWGINYLVSLGQYKEICEQLTIQNVDLTRVKNGTYEGSFDAAGIVSAKMSVTVQDHKITDIRIVNHKYGRGKPGEAVVNKVVEAQSLDVDVISGATNSSKVILKAIENALESGVD